MWPQTLRLKAKYLEPAYNVHLVHLNVFRMRTLLQREIFAVGFDSSFH